MTNRNPYGSVKAAVIEGAASGMTCGQIAKAVGASYQTVHAQARRIKADLLKRSYTKTK